MSKAFVNGTTVRLTATFYDWEGNKVDPTNAKFIVRNEAFAEPPLLEISLDLSNQLGIGEYFYDYVIPMTPANGIFHYEFYGEHNGTPTLDRGKIKTKLVL